MKIFLRILAVAVLLTAFSGVVLAVGDDPSVGGGGGGFTIPNPLSCGSDPNIPPVQDCLAKIIQGLIVISVPITVVMVVVGAYQFMISGGQPEKISTAKKTILYAAIGFAVILLAQGLVFILRDLVGGGSGGGGGGCGDEPPNPCPDYQSLQCINGAWVCAAPDPGFGAIKIPSWIAQNSYDRINLIERSSFY